MTYLAYIRPPEDIVKIIVNHRKNLEENVYKSDNFFHCTLMKLFAGKNSADDMVGDLKNIDFNAFNLVTTALDKFGRDSLVLKLYSAEIHNLHMCVAGTLAQYIDWDETKKHYVGCEGKNFSKYGCVWFGDNYSPHISLAHVKKKTFRKGFKSNLLKGHEFRVDRFYLAQNFGDGWKDIDEFIF